jgi:hypothetical protein
LVASHRGDSFKKGSRVNIIPTGTSWNPIGTLHCAEPAEDMKDTP